MDPDELLLDVEDKLEKTVQAVERDFSHLHTGRASPALLDGVRVDYYGTPTPLKQVAGVSIGDASLLIVKPWDAKILPDIEKAIAKADLGLNPQSDGKVVRVPIPALSEERRRQMAAGVKKRAEEGRVALRNIRHKSLKEVEAGQKSAALPEDVAFKLKDELQKVLKEYETKIDDLASKKEKEILQV